MPRTAATGHHWCQLPPVWLSEAGIARSISMPSFSSLAISSSMSRALAPLVRARSRTLTKRCYNSLTTRRIVVFWNRGGRSGQAVSLYCFMIPNDCRRPCVLIGRDIVLPAGEAEYHHVPD